MLKNWTQLYNALTYDHNDLWLKFWAQLWPQIEVYLYWKLMRDQGEAEYFYWPHPGSAKDHQQLQLILSQFYDQAWNMTERDPDNPFLQHPL